MTNKPRAGQVRRWDFQSDIYRGQYRLVESAGNGRWVIEYMEPTDEEMAEILADTEGARYKDPEDEIMERIDRAGTRTTIKFVSQEQWDRYF